MSVDGEYFSEDLPLPAALYGRPQEWRAGRRRCHYSDFHYWPGNGGGCTGVMKMRQTEDKKMKVWKWGTVMWNHRNHLAMNK